MVQNRTVVEEPLKFYYRFQFEVHYDTLCVLSFFVRKVKRDISGDLTGIQPSKKCFDVFSTACDNDFC